MMSDPSSPWVVLADYRWKCRRGARRSPPKGAKGNEKKTPKQGRKPPPTQEPSDPRPQGDSGAHSVSQPPDRGVGKQNSPQLDLGRSDANARSCWTIANARPQLRRGRGKQRVRLPEPKQTRCQLTAASLTSLVWEGQAGPCICVWLEKERTKTMINDSRIQHVHSCACARRQTETLHALLNPASLHTS